MRDKANVKFPPPPEDNGCIHSVLACACQGCINRATYAAMKALYESPEFAPPVCCECKSTMVLSDFDLAGKFMPFECTNHTNEYEFCGHGERIKL